MILKKIEEKDKKFYTFSFIIILFFCPYTLLRINVIGIPEATSLMIMLFVLLKDGVIPVKVETGSFVFTKFWFIYILVCLVGFVNNYFLTGFSSSTMNDVLFDLLSYFFLFLLCFSMESIIYLEKMDIWKILKYTYICSSFALFTLFLIGLISKTRLIFYYDNFNPFSRNIHHVSMFIAPLPFLGLKVFIKSRSFFFRIFIVFLIFTNILTGLNTGSSKIPLSFLIGTLVLLFIFPLKIKASSQLKFLVFLFVLILILISLTLMWDEIYIQATNYFIESDDQGARSYFYTQALRKIAQSPLVGYGPGPHLTKSENIHFFWDAHQTQITVLLQSGLIGFSLYFIFVLALFSKCMGDIFILAAFIAIQIYSFGGDIMRRLPIWIFLVLFYYYCTKKGSFTLKKQVRKIM